MGGREKEVKDIERGRLIDSAALRMLSEVVISGEDGLDFPVRGLGGIFPHKKNLIYQLNAVLWCTLDMLCIWRK